MLKLPEEKDTCPADERKGYNASLVSKGKDMFLLPLLSRKAVGSPARTARGKVGTFWMCTTSRSQKPDNFGDG